jgi:opacity protein-like surface antigen
MKKIVFIGLMLLVLILIVNPLFVSASDVKVRVAVEEADIRLNPDMTGTVITTVPLGAVLDVRNKKGDWFEVNLPPDDRGFVRQGFIHSSLVEVISDKPQEKEPEPKPVRIPQVQPQREEPRQVYQTQPKYRVMDSGTKFKLLGGLSLGSEYHSDTDYQGYYEDEWRKYQMGLVGGIGIESGGTIGVEMDVLYFQKGVKYQASVSQGGETIDADVSLVIDEISAPIMLKLKFMPGTTPFLLAGGEIAYILSSKINWSYDLSSGYSESGTEDVIESINRLDYGVVFGAGFELYTGATSFVIEARYHYGLANLIKEEERTTPDEYGKTKTIAFMAGIKF